MRSRGNGPGGVGTGNAAIDGLCRFFGILGGMLLGLGRRAILPCSTSLSTASRVTDANESQLRFHYPNRATTTDATYSHLTEIPEALERDVGRGWVNRERGVQNL